MSIRTRLLIILGAAGATALAAALLIPGTSRGADPVLNGSVGNDSSFIITFNNSNGVRVTQLDPGTYTINVNDQGTIHDFHLSGPGVDEATSLDGTGKTTWRVTFTDGKYTYQCDAHPSQMHGTFLVGTPPPPPPKPTVLKGSVGPKKTISLKKGGAKVKSLKAGKFTVKVSDRSAKLNFHLKGPGVSKKTRVHFKGKKTWKVKLKAGKYVYKSDAGKHLKKSFTVH